MKKISILTKILIVLTAVFVLLDTFVIPKAMVAETVSSTNASSNSTSVTQTSTETTTSTVETQQTASATVTDTSYQDENITITISTLREYNTTIHVAEIILSDISYLKTALADDTYGRNIKDTTSNIAEDNNAILAINGDFYGFRDYGFVVRNGHLYRSTGKTDALLIKADGSFEIVDETTYDLQSSLSTIWQALSFGPSLLVDGEITVGVNDEVGQAMQSNPRTAIGVIRPLHYVFIVSDGRTSNDEGLTLYQLATVMKNLGVTTAYNLDGGGSSTMVFNGTLINTPSSQNSERKVSDIVYISY